MDNQFTSPTNSTEQPSASPAGSTVAPETETTQPAQPTHDTVAEQPRPRKSKAKWLIVLLVILLLAALGLAGWQYMQAKSLKDDKAALAGKVETANQELAKAKADASKAVESAKSSASTPASTTTTDIVTGAVASKSDGTAQANALYLPGKVTAIWLEYGTSPTALSTATPKVTQGLGEGTAGSYASQGFNLSKLTAGTNYFYRVAATQNGKTIYGGTASFTQAK
jgi:type II secretory pathway pseudopilin PulG